MICVLITKPKNLFVTIRGVFIFSYLQNDIKASVYNFE